jgi:RNA polymerase sigma-70 factor (ECF subfamily)
MAIVVFKEKELIETCLENNRISQNTLYNKYSPRMYGICLRYAKDEDDAKDILQDSFINVFENLKNFKFNSNLESWIVRIVINTAINHYRKSKFRKTEKLDELDNKDCNISLINIDTSTYDSKTN